MSASANENGAAEQIDEGFRVYVGNLPYSATEEQLRDILKPTGVEPLAVSLPMKFGRPSGFAFVGYKEESDAKKVVEQLNGRDFGDRKLSVEVARSKEEVSEARKANQEKRNAARAARAAERKEKAEAAGEAGATTDAEPKANGRTKKPRGPRRRLPEDGEEAAEGEEAPAAQSAKPKKKRNRKPKTAGAAAATEGDNAAAKEARIDGGEETQEAPAAGEKEAKPKRERKPRGPKHVLTGEQSKSTIFVANLPFSVDDEALASIFTNLSIQVKSAKVVRAMRKGREGSRPFHASKGFGFVEVSDPSQQEEAVKKVDGSLIGDRNISARVAHEVKPAEKEEAAEALQQAGETTA